MCRPWYDNTVSTEGDAGTDDLEPFDAEGDHGQKDRDGARSLRDLQQESGDEDEIDDVYAIDRREAREAGVDLDVTDDGEEPLS